MQRCHDKGPSSLMRHTFGVAFALYVSAGAALLGAWLALASPPNFTSEAVVAVTPRSNGSVPSAAMISLLATRYVAYASSDETVEVLATNFDLQSSNIRSGLSITMPAQTTNIYIESTMASSQNAATVASGLSARLIDLSKEDPNLRASAIVGAQAPTEADGERRRALVVMALLMVAGGAAVSAAVLTTRYRKRGM